MDCGKCSSVCPITRFETRAYSSPRLLVEKAVAGEGEAVLADPLFWSCLSCKRCSELCPSDVCFSEFIRDARHLARQHDHTGPCTHGEVIQTWARLMTDPDLNQARLGWLTGDLAVSQDSDTVYFTGCLPYYDVLFRHLNFEGTAVARATVRILNAMGIQPQVLSNERCCGHDQLWEGDRETFRALARLNLKMLEKTGASRIVTSCPECARTLAIDYPEQLGDHGFEVLHITQLAARKAAGGQLKLKPFSNPPRITYQDPCRLGRHLGVYDDPRALLDLAGCDLEEMPDAKESGQCCGTSCWTDCGQVSKAIQSKRLRQARDTGAGILVTACLKCQIHFRCAQQDIALQEAIGIDIRDIATLVAERIRDAHATADNGRGSV
jgi:Fe-S oxidoreductase